MALTLYRKYRPQRFSDITNQEHIKITLQNELAMDQAAHAYIFAGPRGVGKTTTARIFSKALNCEKRKKGEFEPCNKCAACQEINEARAIDFIEIDAASHTGVENVRENIIENVRFSPSRLQHKVFIIDEAHMLSTQAFNALLKTLEEPPERVVFILATTEVHKIPATIISRCQRFDFKKINADEIQKRLEFITAEEGIKVDKNVLQRVARLSEGCVRDSESLLGQILAIGEKNISEEQADMVLPHTNFEQVIELLFNLSAKNQARGIEIINQLVQDGIDLKQFSSETLEFLRELLLAKVMNKSSELLASWSKDIQKSINQILQTWAADDIVRIIELLLQKQKDLKQAFPIQLPLEIFVIRATETQEKKILKAPEPVKSEPKPSPPPEPGKSKKDEDSTSPDTDQDKIDSGATKNKASLPRRSPEPQRRAKAGITIDMVKDKWQDFMSHLGQTNHSLPLILQIGQPMEVNEDVVHIGLKYTFHQDKLMDMKNRVIVEDALSHVLGEQVRIQAQVVEDLEQDKAADEKVDQVLEQFGGKVIE